MAQATRFNDGRHSKWGQLRERQAPLLHELQRLANSRPSSRFNLDDWVKTPVGWYRIADRYHADGMYRYRILTNAGSISYKESELSPLPDTWFTPDSEVKLPHGAMAKVVGYAGNLVILELRPKQLVGFAEEELRKHNPLMDYAAQLLYRVVCGEYLFEVDAKRAFQKAMPNYPIVRQERV